MSAIGNFFHAVNPAPAIGAAVAGVGVAAATLNPVPFARRKYNAWDNWRTTNAANRATINGPLQRPNHWGRNILRNHHTCVVINSISNFTVSGGATVACLGILKNIARAHTTPGWLTVGAGFTGLGLSATSVFVSAYMAATGDDENYHPANVTGSCLNAVGMAITTGVALYSNMDNCDFGHDCVVAHLNEGGLALAGFGALMALTLTTPVQFGARAYHMLSFVSTVAAGLGGYFNGISSALSVSGDCHAKHGMRERLQCSGDVFPIIGGMFACGLGAVIAGVGFGNTFWLTLGAQDILPPHPVMPPGRRYTLHRDVTQADVNRGAAAARWQTLAQAVANGRVRMARAVAVADGSSVGAHDAGHSSGDDGLGVNHRQDVKP